MLAGAPLPGIPAAVGELLEGPPEEAGTPLRPLEDVHERALHRQRLRRGGGGRERHLHPRAGPLACAGDPGVWGVTEGGAGKESGAPNPMSS